MTSPFPNLMRIAVLIGILHKKKSEVFRAKYPKNETKVLLALSINQPLYYEVRS